MQIQFLFLSKILASGGIVLAWKLHLSSIQLLSKGAAQVTAARPTSCIQPLMNITHNVKLHFTFYYFIYVSILHTVRKIVSKC